jgi:hypothetical protein
MEQGQYFVLSVILEVILLMVVNVLLVLLEPLLFWLVPPIVLSVPLENIIQGRIKQSVFLVHKEPTILVMVQLLVFHALQVL